MSKLISILFIVSPLFVIIGASRASHDPHSIFLAVIGGGSQGSLSIANVSDNRSDYPDGQIPKYEKLEITFQVLNSVAQNNQLPYDPNPPFGIDPANYPKHKGVSVDAYFLPPGETSWDNAFEQPGFYYRYYDYDVKDDRDWFVPQNNADWKVRFSPHIPGKWQYKIKVQDESGVYETPVNNFMVTDSDNKGFIKVSKNDPRYFEYDNGDPFFHMGFQRGLKFDDPILNNQAVYEQYGQNNIKIIRTWASGIYGAAWPEFLGAPGKYDGYLPRPGVRAFHNQADNKESLTVHIDYELEGNTGWFTNCAWQRWDDPEAVKQNTDYRIRVKYRAFDITGPRDPTYPDYGLVLKTGGSWTDACKYPNEGAPLTNYGHNNNDWEYLETIWNSGDSNWLTKLYIVLENVHEGNVFLDSITAQEVLENDQYGPNIMVEGNFQYDLVYPEAPLWSLDQLLNMAKENDVYIKIVIGDKSDKMWWKIDDDGTYVINETDNKHGYYGNWYNLSTNYTNRTRWLQRAWWRYLQARYGYSPNIHSWEFTNEGDPSSGRHWSATDLLGRYMKCEVFGIPTPDSNGDGLPIEGDKCDYDHPNSHMVTTSFWHSFPAGNFWGNTDWPNVDYADVHKYSSASNDPNHVIDTASFHLDYSALYRQQLDSASSQNNIPTKPIVRGEVGLSSGSPADDLLEDTNGVWLHNFTWAALDPGGMYEIFWELRDEIDTPPGPDGQPGLYEIYKYFGDFIEDIPLNNGNYEDANATLTDGNLRVTGQKDLVNNRAHVWVQNKNHTWKKVVNGNAGTGLGGTVTIAGFSPNTTLDVEFHAFTISGLPTITRSSTTTGLNGDLLLDLPTNPNISDVGIKIGSYPISPSPDPIRIDKTGPVIEAAGEPVTYTLSATNNLTSTLTSVVITDVLPLNSNYVSGGILAGDVVSFTVGNLLGEAMTSHQFVVTATETITNSDYRVSTGEAFSTVGSYPVITTIEYPVADLNATNSSPTVLGNATTLTATISAGTHVTYTWDFGDGQNGSEPNVAHVYPAADIYTATVNATNGVSTAQAMTLVTIAEPDSLIYLPCVMMAFQLDNVI